MFLSFGNYLPKLCSTWWARRLCLYVDRRFRAWPFKGVELGHEAEASTRLLGAAILSNERCRMGNLASQKKGVEPGLSASASTRLLGAYSLSQIGAAVNLD